MHFPTASTRADFCFIERAVLRIYAHGYFEKIVSRSTVLMLMNNVLPFGSLRLLAAFLAQNIQIWRKEQREIFKYLEPYSLGPNACFTWRATDFNCKLKGQTRVFYCKGKLTDIEIMFLKIEQEFIDKKERLKIRKYYVRLSEVLKQLTQTHRNYELISTYIIFEVCITFTPLLGGQAS